MKITWFGHSNFRLDFAWGRKNKHSSREKWPDAVLFDLAEAF